MNVFRCVAFGLLALLVAILGNAEAQTIQGKFDKTKGKTMTAPSADLLTAPLYPPDVIAKLKLTAEQKPEVDKLLAEFNAKLKDIAAKGGAAATTTTTPDPKAKIKGKGGNIGQASPQFAAVLNLQSEYEKKVAEILTIDQRNLLDQLLAKGGTTLK